MMTAAVRILSARRGCGEWECREFCASLAMIKPDLVARLASRHPLIPRRDVEASVSAILAEIGLALASDRRVELRRFCVFTVRSRSATIGRNPNSGAPIALNARKLVRLRIGKSLLGRLNQPATSA
jgi:integration host factor subunit beta